MQLGALFAEDAMISVCFLVFIVYVGVGFSAVGAAYKVFVSTFFPVVVFGAEWAFLLLLTKPSSMSESKAFEASSNGDEVSTLHMHHWSLILWIASNSVRRFGLTSTTTCLESSNVLSVNFLWSIGSSRWIRLFYWRIMFLMSASSTSLGTNVSNRVGSFFLGRPTFNVLSLLTSFSRVSRSVSAYIPRIRHHLIGFWFATVLTPLASAETTCLSFRSLVLVITFRCHSYVSHSAYPTFWGLLWPV